MKRLKTKQKWFENRRYRDQQKTKAQDCFSEMSTNRERTRMDQPHILEKQSRDHFDITTSPLSPSGEAAQGATCHTDGPPKAEKMAPSQAQSKCDHLAAPQNMALMEGHQSKLGILLGYFAVSDGQNFVFVRQDDGYVNLTHILRAGGKDRFEVAKLKAKKYVLRYETIRSGPVEVRGTYVELSEAIKFCEKYKVWVVAAALKDYKSSCSVGCPTERPHSTKEGEAEQRTRQNRCEIPPLPHLPANNLDGSRTVTEGDSCDRVVQNPEPLLHSTPYYASEVSHLSLISPSFGTDVSSINYAGFLHEDDNVPLWTETPGDLESGGA
jgi:hypothetical protein